MSNPQALVATRKTRLGDVLKHEYGLKDFYARENRSLTVSGEEQIGTVYKADGTILLAAEVAALTGDDNLSILVDDCIYTDGLGAGTREYAVIWRGPAVLRRKGLKFGDTLSEGQIDTVVASLVAQGFKVGPTL
jgi:hypothetical protein